MVRLFRIVFIIFILASCQVQHMPRGKMVHVIIGVWDIRSVESDQKPDSVMLPAFQKLWKTLLINANIIFFPDQSFRATLGERDYQGTWHLMKNRTLLLSEKAVNNQYHIRFISANEMILQTSRNTEVFKIWLKRRPGTGQ